MSLKDLTWEHHKNAERQEFVKVMFSGSIDPKLYATYLWNQFPQYELLEVMTMRHGVLNDIPNILRSKAILEDFRELWPSDQDPPPQCPVVKRYLDHIIKISEDPKKLLAHIYVRHMGDLSGGQMIAKRVPGSGKFYKFDADVNEYKEKIRAKINDDMADEAKLCFEFATDLFKELMQYVPK